jgi:hypothetical protein
MKTRRIKRNKSPIRPFKRAKAMVAIAGDMIVTRGIRGRTVVKRIEDAEGRRLKTARLIAPAAQLPEPNRKTSRPIFVGRVYTGVPRGKVYPAHGPRRYPPAPGSDAPTGFLGGLTKRVKSVLVGA